MGLPDDFKDMIKRMDGIGLLGDDHKIRETSPEIERDGRTRIISEMPSVDEDSVEIREVSSGKKIVLGKSEGVVYIGIVEYNGVTDIDSIEIINGVVTIYLDN